MKKFAAFVIPLAALLAACAEEAGPAATTVTETATQTETAPATPAPTTPAPTTTTPAPAKSTSQAASPSTSDTWSMPNLVGKSLQQAQDSVQSASGNPLFFSTSTDATGDERVQIIDANWKVCSQTPAAGTKATAETNVNFAVVKTEEKCP